MRPRTNTTSYRDLLYLLIPTFILILAWIGFTIYGSRVKSTITEFQSRQIQPISPAFDLATLELLKTREQVDPILTFEAPPTEESLVGSASGEPLPEITVPLTPEEATIPSTPSASTQQAGGTQ